MPGAWSWVAWARVLAYSAVVSARNCVALKLGHETVPSTLAQALITLDRLLLRLKQRQLRFPTRTEIGRDELSGVTIEVGTTSPPLRTKGKCNRPCLVGRICQGISIADARNCRVLLSHESQAHTTTMPARACFDAPHSTQSAPFPDRKDRPPGLLPAYHCALTCMSHCRCRCR